MEERQKKLEMGANLQTDRWAGRLVLAGDVLHCSYPPNLFGHWLHFTLDMHAGRTAECFERPSSLWSKEDSSLLVYKERPEANLPLLQSTTLPEAGIDKGN